MEGAKKKQFDDTVNVKIQRKFDLVFESATGVQPVEKRTTALSDDSDFSELEFGGGDEPMSENAKKEQSSPKIDLDFGSDDGLDFQSSAEAPASEKKEGTGKLSIVPDESDGLEFNLDFGDDTPDMPDIPAVPAASISPAQAAAPHVATHVAPHAEETKSDAHFELDLTAGDDEDLIETRPSNAPSVPSFTADLAEEGGLVMDNDFEAEIERAASKVQLKENTQPTIVYDKSKTGIDFDTTASTNSSADLMTTEEAKANIESTIKDIIRPKPLTDSTQEIDLSGLSEAGEATGEKDVSMDFSITDKVDSTSEFDLDGVVFADKDDYIAPPAQTHVEAPLKSAVASPMSSTMSSYDPEPMTISERVDRTHTSFVSDEESSRFQATIRQLREERDSLLNEMKTYKGQVREVEQDNLTLKAALDEAKIEISIIRKRHLTEMEDLKYRVSLAEEKRALAEERAKNAEAKKEKLEQRVRIDFNQVKQREKELETKLEMLSIDVDSQVHSRDQKILELRRKIDALEFNMENVSIREQKSQDDKRKLEDKLNKIMKTLRHSIKNLEDDIDQVAEEALNDNDDKMKTGQRSKT